MEDIKGKINTVLSWLLCITVSYFNVFIVALSLTVALHM